MAATRHVAVIVGSLRKESFNRKLAVALQAIAPATLALEIVAVAALLIAPAASKRSPAPPM